MTLIAILTIIMAFILIGIFSDGSTENKNEFRIYGADYNHKSVSLKAKKSNRHNNMIVKACCETSLRSFGITCRSIDVISHGFFKERSNAKTSSSDPENEADKTRRYRFIQRRLMLISEEFDLPITSGRIQDSGLLYYLQKEINESGQTFNDYIATDAAKRLAQRYDIHTEFYTQILKEKFDELF